MVTIPFAEFPFFTEDTVLDQASYRLYFAWNERASRWSLSIYDLSDVALVEGIPVAIDQEAFGQFPTRGLPPGQLYAADASGKLQAVGRKDILQGLVDLVYVPKAEV